MSSRLPCALRNWQRLQLVSRWRLSSYSFSADRLLTFIVSPAPVPQFTSQASGYVIFDITSYKWASSAWFGAICLCIFEDWNKDRSSGGCGASTVARCSPTWKPCPRTTSKRCSLLAHTHALSFTDTHIAFLSIHWYDCLSLFVDEGRIDLCRFLQSGWSQANKTEMGEMFTVPTTLMALIMPIVPYYLPIL